MERAHLGENINYKKAKTIVARYKDAANPKTDPITFDTKTQQDRQIQAQLEVPAKVAIDPKAEPLEDDSAGKEQSKKEELQRKEAQLAEPEMRSSSDAPVSLPELVLDDAVEKDQSKQELQRKELEVENFAPGSSNSTEELLEPVANETDNHPGQDEANDDANQAQEQVIGEKDQVIGDRLESVELLEHDVNEIDNQAGQDEAKGKAIRPTNSHTHPKTALLPMLLIILRRLR